MMRYWFGIALLSASWLFGVGYYRSADWVMWSICVAAGSLLLSGAIRPIRAGLGAVLSLVMLLVVTWQAPWPYKAIPVLMVAGVFLSTLPLPWRWPGALGGGAIASGAVMLSQSLAFLFYEARTARSHELPGLLAWVVGLIAKALDLETGVTGSTVAIHSMRRAHPIGATWELLVDPVTVCFFVGGVLLLVLRRAEAHPLAAERADSKSNLACIKRLGAQVGMLALATGLWLALRVGILLAAYSHRVLRTEFDAPLNVMLQFFSPSVHLLMVLGASLFAWGMVRDRQGPGAAIPSGQAAREYSLAALAGRWGYCIAGPILAAISVALLTAAIYHEPAGARKGGRVLVDEVHSKWEPTQRPMDESWYGHKSGYNYASLYDYTSRFYSIGRIEQKITAATLAQCDVLILKTPTSRLEADEVKLVVNFVKNGGGLMLIGEHTDVFGTGTALNDVAMQFGFSFRPDCCFGIDSVFEELYTPPLVPHPIIQHMGPLNFAVSCSIDPGSSRGEAVIRGIGLKNAQADYHATNFYPQIEDYPDSRYGAFVQLYVVESGRGRVVAFADSTILSNFSFFEPGKSEMFLGMTEWLNRRQGDGWVNGLLGTFGIISGLGALFALVKARAGFVVAVSAGLLAWSATASAVASLHTSAMPPPPATRPMVNVTLDRTVSEVKLPTGGFISGKPDGFGIFERWIQRVGYFPKRAKVNAAPAGEMLVFLQPTIAPTPAYRNAVVEYVKNGGKVLIVDSAENPSRSAGSLLWPFGMGIKKSDPVGGEMVGPGFHAIPVENCAEITGGQGFLSVGGKTVGAMTMFGKGTVTAIGFGSRLNDANYGFTGDVVPDAKLREVYEVQFRLMRLIAEGPAATRPAASRPLKVESDAEAE